MRNYEKVVKELLDEHQLTEEMRDELKRFNSELIQNRGLRTSTASLCLGHICSLGKFLVKKGYKSYREATKDDIIEYLGAPYPKIEKQRKSVTMNSIKGAIRTFYRWLLTGKTNRANIKDGYPPIVDWIVLSKPQIREIQPEDMIQPEEFIKLLSVCRVPKDRALLQLLMETGGRIGEILSLRIKDVYFTKDSTYINIWQSKTLERKIYLFDSVEDLKVLLNQHPQRDNPDAPLFLMDRGKRMWDYHAVACVLKRLTKKAGITKNIHAHLFRHSRCSIDAKNGLPGPLAEKKFGWTKGSNMYSRYSHIRDEDVKNWDEKARGILNGKTEDAHTSKKCFRCGEFNSWTSKFCVVCGMVLDKDVVVEQEKFMKDIYEYIDQKFKEMEDKS